MDLAIGERLREFRLMAGLTQRELGEAIRQALDLRPMDFIGQYFETDETAESGRNQSPSSLPRR